MGLPLNNVQMIGSSFLGFLLPKLNADNESWTRLLNDPMQVSDADLESMFSLRQSTSQTQIPLGQIIFYIRSFRYEKQQLEAVFDLL